MNARLRTAIALNLLLPGCGLIIARREWLGVALTIIFTLCTQMLIFGFLIAPDSVSTWLMVIIAVLDLCTWSGAQWLLGNRIQILTDPSLRSQVTTCHGLAESALREGRLDDALGALQVALTVDDENVDTYVKLARLFALLGQFDKARRSWRKVEQLDRKQAFRREMIQTMQRLPKSSA